MNQRNSKIEISKKSLKQKIKSIADLAENTLAKQTYYNEIFGNKDINRSNIAQSRANYEKTLKTIRDIFQINLTKTKGFLKKEHKQIIEEYISINNINIKECENMDKKSILKTKTELMTDTLKSQERKYAMSKLANPNRQLFFTLRAYLALMHEPDAPKFYRHDTKVTLIATIASEGFPLDINTLQDIYTRYLQNLGLSTKEIQEDLLTHRNEIYREYRIVLQTDREITQKYFK